MTFDRPQSDTATPASTTDPVAKPAGGPANTSNPTPQLLLVEDDHRLSRALEWALQQEGYDVWRAGTGREALARVRREQPDLVLLDLVLPDIDGLDVCRQIRESLDIPVIVVSGRTASDEVIAGFEAGADDYVVKPLIVRELALRIQALLRRASSLPSDTTLTVGDLRLSSDSGVARRAGSEVELQLTRTETNLLRELMENPGQVVSRETLLERVWGYRYFDDTRLLDVHIRRLRLKLEDDPSRPRLIETVRGFGYRLCS